MVVKSTNESSSSESPKSFLTDSSLDKRSDSRKSLPSRASSASLKYIVSPVNTDGNSIYNFFHKIQKLFPLKKKLSVYSELDPNLVTRPGQLSIINEIKSETVETFKRKYDDPDRSAANTSLHDFSFYRTVGKGSYGRVMLSLHKKSKKFYAVKLLEKKKIVYENQVIHVLDEKRIMSACNHPNISKFLCCFKDTTNLYFVFDFHSNGDLFAVLNKRKKFTEAESKFYAANIYLAFEYLHLMDVLYRDLKPENIILCSNGYLKLTDFGFAKRVERYTYSHCGTPDYLAPEIIERMPYGKSVDWWALGVLIYELNFGEAPFKKDASHTLYNQIVDVSYKLPPDFSPELKSIVKRLLLRNVKKRLGTERATEVCSHRWFREIDWEAVYKQQAKAPFMPNTRSPLEILFSDEYKDQVEESIKLYSTMKHKEEFRDF